MDQPLATLEEVATYLQVPAKTLYRWRSVGEGPPGFRVGKHVRYRWSAVHAWLETRADQSQGPTHRRAEGRVDG